MIKASPRLDLPEKIHNPPKERMVLRILNLYRRGGGYW